MEIAVKTIAGAVITMLLVICCLDVNLNRQMMSAEYHANRASDQGSLINLQDKYNKNEELTSVEMLNEWLINFIDTHGIDMEEVVLKFHFIETEPPVYLVTIEGYEDEYTFLNGDAYFEYMSGTTIITEDTE